MTILVLTILIHPLILCYISENALSVLMVCQGKVKILLLSLNLVKYYTIVQIIT